MLLKTMKDFDPCPQNLTCDIRNSTDSIVESHGLHRPRTLYLIRHGEAEHNVLEAKAQKKAEAEAQKLSLSSEETLERMEEARKSVLNDVSLSDAPLTERGRQQAKEASRKLKEMIDINKIHHPTEAMCSPLSRCLETCKILLEDSDLKAHVRPEISERRTMYPPDKPKPLDELQSYTRDDGRFLIGHNENLNLETESKEMLRTRANKLFHLLMECKHRHVLIVSHKGFLRELERGLLEMPESPLFDNCEMRVYRVVFTKGDRKLYHQQRIA